MKLRHNVPLLSAFALALIDPRSCAAQATDQEKAIAAWRAREQACKSFKIKWKETQTFVAGSLTHPRIPKGVSIPADTTNTDAFFMLCADGEKMKQTSDALEVTERYELKRQSKTTAFNGALNKSFRPSQIHEYPQGYVGDEAHLPGLNVYNLRPVLLLFAPFRHVTFGYASEADLLKNYRDAGPAVVRDQKCVLLRETGGSASFYHELWLDPASDFVPLREITFAAGKPVLQIDWEEYKRDGPMWVPSAWKIQELKGGAVDKAFSSTVLEFTVNKPISPDEFEIEFPQGTWVIDRRTRDKNGNPSHYIVKASGARTISREELATKTYRELNGEVHLKQVWILALVPAGLLVVAVALYYFKRRK